MIVQCTTYTSKKTPPFYVKLGPSTQDTHSDGTDQLVHPAQYVQGIYVSPKRSIRCYKIYK